jgi:hypothetical protein
LILGSNAGFKVEGSTIGRHFDDPLVPAGELEYVTKQRYSHVPFGLLVKRVP